MNKLYFLILSLLLFSACGKQHTAQIDKMNFEELFNYFLNTQDSLEEERLVKLLDDSIPANSQGYFFPNEQIYSIKKELIFKLVLDSTPMFDDVKIKERNIFSLFIDRKNNQYIRWDEIEDLYSHKEYIIQFLTNSNNVDSLPEKRLKILDQIGEVKISKGAFIINTQSIPDTTTLRTDWRLIKSSILFFKDIIFELRNSSSLKYWEQQYSALSLRRKYVISQLHPIGIWFKPNQKYRPKPPPPPPPISSDEVLEIIEELEIDEELLK